ncbi:MAG TPA: DUF1080 domain-containing protein [Candidatus Paceibacterota bacterium]|nr:DUF1080 domain-containing protein [Verrucomicrobiota bacterium]HSA12739.1 DUF1080 domain-containing protein [Candidatus Paceibacterota bacterium]
MKTKPGIIIAPLLAAIPLFAQQPADRWMGDWQGEVTINNETKNVGVYMIPLSNGKYEARFVADLLQRGPYLYRLKGEIRDGQFRFMDDIPFDVGRVFGTTGQGVVVDAALWAGTADTGGAKGTIAGRLRGAFALKQSERISPELGKAPPAGAVVLFDGKSLDAWRHREEGKAVKWKILPEGVMEVGGGDIVSREKFRDQKVHLEFRLPYMPTAFGQGRANSGVYLQGRYEVQVLDSYGLEGQDNECGGIYTVSRPKVNMCAPPLQWQSYDISFTAARFDAAGNKTARARITVVQNGVVVQDDTALPGVTGGAVNDRENEPEGLLLQDHGNPVQYRNIWIERR